MGKDPKDSTGTALATSEQKRLDELEAIIAAGFQGFAESGGALREIRDSGSPSKRLYRADHSTFEAYCQTVWGLSHRHANRLIEASSVQGILGPVGPVLPSERVARELAPLASQPEELIGAWQRAVEEHGTPTAAQVRKIVQPEPETVVVMPEETEVVAEATAERVPRKEIEAPKVPTRSQSTLTSVTRAYRAALADGHSPREISVAIDKVLRGDA